MTRLQVKICCISSIEEAQLAIESGADLLGLVSQMPSGPGVIPDDDITRVRDWIGDRAQTVLLTSRTKAADIVAQLRAHRPHVVQLCDAVDQREIDQIRQLSPVTRLMAVIHVRDEQSVTEAITAAKGVDALLLDSGNPSATVRELGGTGRVHDWAVSRAIRDAVNVPVFLAGGLRAENVAEAVSRVQPTGVDVCSGVRVDGGLASEKLRPFIDNARKTFDGLT